MECVWQLVTYIDKEIERMSDNINLRKNKVIINHFLFINK